MGVLKIENKNNQRGKKWEKNKLLISNIVVIETVLRIVYQRPFILFICFLNVFKPYFVKLFKSKKMKIQTNTLGN